MPIPQGERNKLICKYKGLFYNSPFAFNGDLSCFEKKDNSPPPAEELFFCFNNSDPLTLGGVGRNAKRFYGEGREKAGY